MATLLSGLFCGLMVFTLVGCSGLSPTKFLDESSSAASQSLYYAFAGQPDVTLTEQQIADLQYAANYVKFDNQARALIILGYDDGHSLQWVSANQEVLTVSFVGRVLRTDYLISNLDYVSDVRNDPLNCWHERAEARANQREFKNECPTNWQRTLTTNNNEQRQHWWVTTDFAYSDTDSGYQVIEQGTASNAQGESIAIRNEFNYSLHNGAYRPTVTTQWVSPELGMLQQQEVKAFSNYLQPYPRFYSGRAATPASTPEIASLPLNNPQQHLWVRVENGKRHDLLFNREVRMTELLQAAGLPDSPEVMWAQTKISSQALQRQFAGKREGMYIRLKLLAQTYRHDGKSKLAEQAEQLAENFLSWPLKASYITDFSLAKARMDLAENPLFNFAQAPRTDKNQPHYTVFLSFENQAENQSENQVTSLPELPIAEQDLPKGFRDINQQLRLFMRYWHTEANQERQ